LKSARFRSDALLLLVAILWGSSFAVQRVAAQHLGVFLFNGLRFLLAVLILLPFARQKDPLERGDIAWIILAGLCAFGGSALQQAGLQFTAAANAGFITSLYVVLVPVLLFVLWKQRVSWVGWVAASLAVAGAMLLSTGGMGFRLAGKAVVGDGLELLGSVGWALHVIAVGRGARRMAVLTFSIGQYLVAGTLNLGMGLVLEGRLLSGLAVAWWTVVYIAVFSTAIGYTLQAVGQRHAPPADAAIILSLESVFAALFGYLFLTERLASVQKLGCALIFGAVLLSQVKRKAGEGV
jgi:drug/metabolite transporter (DMT)-like permease